MYSSLNFLANNMKAFIGLLALELAAFRPACLSASFFLLILIGERLGSDLDNSSEELPSLLDCNRRLLIYIQ